MSEGEVPVKRRRKGCWISLAVLATVLVSAGLYYGPTLLSAFRTYGWSLFYPPEKHAYNATSEQNLKALYQAMILHHDSEGQFPDADKWMDSIENRLRTNDLQKEEEKKKLVRPDLAGQIGKFGYAMNDAADGKYKDDVGDPSKTPLIYESKQDTRNAHGDPSSDRNGLAIAVDGTILPSE
jgi:hypothetical protein